MGSAPAALAIDVLRTLAAGELRPPPKLTVSQWAGGDPDRNIAPRRVLDARSSSEPGPWRNERTPYLVEPMDRMGPGDPAETVVIMAGSQLGKSEAVMNALGFYVDAAPAPILMVQPTKEAVERFSRQRITPLVERSPTLRDKVAERKSRDSANTLKAKEFPGGVLFLCGSQSSTDLSANPIRILVLDEIDRFLKEIPGEGDPVEIAERRTTTFHNRKILKTSTPTVAFASRIEAEYAATDQRRFMVPCPYCGTYQLLAWGRVKWEAGDYTTTRYQCEACEELIPNSRKPWMLERGYWEATPEDEAEAFRNSFDPPIKRDPRAVGYWISSLYSPWLSWPEVVRAFLKCRKDPAALRVFVNTILGEVWRLDDGESVDESDLLSRREAFGAGSKGPAVPLGVAVLTAGVDVQADRFEVEVVGWGIGEESWSIDYFSIYGDTSVDPKTPGSVWLELRRALRETTYKGANGVDYPIAASCVDTGFQALNVYAFVKPLQKHRIWGVKGKANRSKLWPKVPTRRNKGKIDLYVIGVDVAKESIYSRLRKAEPGPGYCHFPEDRDPSYFEQLTAERLKTRYHRGFKVRHWELPSGRRNEALDLRVYALAALHGWKADRNTLERALDSFRGGAEGKKRKPVRKKRTGWLGGSRSLGRRGHWIDR